MLKRLVKQGNHYLLVPGESCKKRENIEGIQEAGNDRPKLEVSGRYGRSGIFDLVSFEEHVIL